MLVTATKSKQKISPVKNKWGQYFTPEMVANFMLALADLTLESRILEPACGEGIFLKLLIEQGYFNFSAYEIDPTLAVEFPQVKHESFVSASVSEKFDLIIGNPPYIRWKNLDLALKNELLKNAIWNQYCNSLCDYLYIFILKAIRLLKENGQLIFICPEYWMSTTHALALRNYMVEQGYFEVIYHFNETIIFEKVAVSIVIFKFIKSQNKKENFKLIKFLKAHKLTQSLLNQLKNEENLTNVEYLTIPQFKKNETWVLNHENIGLDLKILTERCCIQNSVFLFEKNIHENLFLDQKNYTTLHDVCEIGNGLVSGLDQAFQFNKELEILTSEEKKALISVVKAKDLNVFLIEKITNYIFLPSFVRDEKILLEHYPNFYQHFQLYKENLEKRYQYNRKINYWEWVFLRNFNLFQTSEKRIFIPCKERISHKNYFRFALVEENIFPTQDVTAIFKKSNTKESLEYIVAYLNHPLIFSWFKNKGIIKGNIVEFSEKPLSELPFLTINWKNSQEVSLHQNITTYVQAYQNTKNQELLTKINFLLNEILNIKKC